VTPGEVLPARELLGDMYMAMDDYEKALIHYELSLEKHQNRFNSLYGAGLAAEKIGNTEKAYQFYTRLLEMTAGATGDRPELVHASKFMDERMGKAISLK